VLTAETLSSIPCALCSAVCISCSWAAAKHYSSHCSWKSEAFPKSTGEMLAEEMKRKSRAREGHGVS